MDVSGVAEVLLQRVEHLRKFGDPAVPIANEPSCVQIVRHACPLEPEVIRCGIVQSQTGEISLRVTGVEDAVHLGGRGELAFGLRAD
jgi:hypothetical protein